MCGVTGYYDYSQSGFCLDEDRFGKIVDILHYRGPDDRGTIQFEGLGLGHRRLAIIDLEMDRARQPMSTKNGDAWISYNGEIYNYRELRHELIEKGHQFRTSTDTEVILHSYLEWGINCLDKFIGIFAFALWDARSKTLWLARDQLGVKPLFYADVSGTLLFSSEVTPILAFPGFPDDYDARGIDAYFTFGFVPAPMSGYRNIRQVLPGEYIRISRSGISSSRYWKLKLDAEKHAGTEEELLEEYTRLFSAAVHRQMVSDVPVGAFLSSGTDSFAVVNEMQKLNDYSTRTFTIGFNNPEYSELDNSEISARALKARIDSKIVDIDFDAIVDKIRPHAREPFADSSCIPTYELCAVAAEHTRVALSGDGADELLGGYQTYRANRYSRLYRRIPEVIRRNVLLPLAKMMPDSGGKYTYREKARRFVYGAEKGQWRDHCSWRNIFTEEIKSSFYTDEFKNKIYGFDATGLYEAHITDAKEAGCEELDCYLYADLAFYLPNDMLTKMDRMGMAHGLEVRVPFLDLEFIEFCWRLPVNFKIRNNVNKYILRRSIDEKYPDKLKKLPKSGFNYDYQSNSRKEIDTGNEFLRERSISYDESFGGYHMMMLEFLLSMMKKH